MLGVLLLLLGAYGCN